MKSFENKLHWSYEDAMQYMSALNRFGKKDGLNHIKRLMEILGNPHINMKIIHIAGTNGKGSISAMLSNILQAGNYTTGLFISPHIEDFRERITIDGNPIPKDELAKISYDVKSAVEKIVNNGYPWPTEFDFITAIGFLYFSNKKLIFPS